MVKSTFVNSAACFLVKTNVEQEIFDERKARGATTVEEAEVSLREFIREGLTPDSKHHIHDRSQGYDLFLPWFLEVIEYVQAEEGKEALQLLQLQRLYMDAAWSLVMKGVLRPGPNAMTGAGEHNVYGRAFSLIQGAAL